MQRYVVLIVIMVSLSLTSQAHAGGKSKLHSIPVGKGEIELHLGKVKLKAYTYKPKNFDHKHGPMILVFHGHGRNPKHYRDASEPVAKHCKGLVVAPLFDEKQFPGDTYIHGHVFAKGQLLPQSEWTYSLVPRIIEEVRKHEDQPKMHYYFFGHSGGGQFVMRLMAFVKLHPVEAVAANPGSLLFPTTDLPFPYGFGKLPEALSSKEHIKAFLGTRLTLYSGTADNDPKHPELDHSPDAEKQGPHRLARANHCMELAHKVAKAGKYKCEWRHVEAPGVGHEGAKMLHNPRALVALFDRRK